MSNRSLSGKIYSEETHPGYGAVAQLEEQLLCKQQVVGSSPIGSTKDELCAP